MSTRALIILIIISVVFMVGGIGIYAWMLTWEAPLWGVKGPLIRVFLSGSASGAGLAGFFVFCAGAIQNTKSRIKKQEQQRKTLEVLRRVK